MTDETKVKTVEQVYKEFLVPFPEEALQTDNSRGFDLTSVKAQYIVERLNTVCGVSGWRLDGSWKDATDAEGVLYIGRLTIFFDRVCGPSPIAGDTRNHYVEAIGYSPDKKNTGDSYKGARTDALSKAASTLGIANEVFKGNVKPPSKKDKAAAKPADKSPVATSPKAPVVEQKKPASFANKAPSTGF